MRTATKPFANPSLAHLLVSDRSNCSRTQKFQVPESFAIDLCLPPSSTMEGVEVPSYFLCPISLETMRDPVTLTTGITYDRESIERWLFSGKQRTCPVTKQTLSDIDLTPNHTLRRIIQAWCAANASNGVERFPTPRPPVDRAQIAALLDEAAQPQTQVAALRKLRAIVAESDRNRRCVEACAGAVEVLASIVERNASASVHDGLEHVFDGADGRSASATATDESLNILCSLQLSEHSLLALAHSNAAGFLEALAKILSQSNYQSRAYAMLLMKSLLSFVTPAVLSGLSQEFFDEIVNMLRDQVSYPATKAALRVLCGAEPWGRNRVRVVRAGAVPALIELLLDGPEKRICEMAMVVLGLLCGCAEGRADFVGHAAGIALVSKRMLRVSQLATGMAVKILYSVAKHSPSPAVLQEMLNAGVVSKLCMMIQMDCGATNKERIQEMLRLHSKVWRRSPCLAPRLQASYPSSS